ncbi:transposable element Tcb1 transposase [Trichonephila clavipes]|nr:transposable element Tcb1 transposase [Trichonephila clavipes]
MLNCSVMHRHTGLAPGTMVWGVIGYHSRTPFVHIAGTLNRHFRGVGASCTSLLSGSLSGSFADRKHVIHGCSTINPITPAVATPDHFCQLVEAAWSAVPQELIQSLFESMRRRVATVISNIGGYSGY